MQKISGLVVLAVCLVAAYLGWQTSQESPEVLKASRDAACGPYSGCTVEAEAPHRVERNVFRHRYDWATSLGPAIVECRKAKVWIGPWDCKVERDRKGGAGLEVGAYPDELKRGQAN